MSNQRLLKVSSQEEEYSREEIGEFPCQFFDGEALYDLKGLSSYEEDFYVTLPTGDTVYFNPCRLTTPSCPNDVGDTFAVIEHDGHCTPLTDGHVEGTLVLPTDSPNGLQGIRIERSSVIPCPGDESRKMGFALEVYCNEKAALIPQNMEEDASDECVYEVHLEHNSGCAIFNLLPFLRVLGLMMIGSGLLLMKMGHRATKRFMQFVV